ncbi:MAG: metal-dependent phosphohydrolase [Anaerolineae bacterium]|nr:metal-dependent phosphohydrolase [Anaerolineae bacterium]
MLNFQKLIIDHFVEELKLAYQETYSLMSPEFGNTVAWSGRLSLENLASSDSLYHNLEHTMMVTLVGQSILKGKHLCEGGVTPKDWMHFMLALLFHDIGYVRGICSGDDGYTVATGVGAAKVKISPGASNAVLKDYHVDRSKLFVMERFGGKLLVDVDVELVISYIEMTRFPPPKDQVRKDIKGYHSLVRAADFIGQLGDPGYWRKIPALFYEFEEVGANDAVGYTSPGDMRKGYAKFYWNVVASYIQDALRYLAVTQDGKQWIANLHSHIFESEHTDF